MPRVRVDGERCQGHARCGMFAPEAFEYDEEGYAHVVPEYAQLEEIPADIATAVENCPELAIMVEED